MEREEENTDTDNNNSSNNNNNNEAILKLLDSVDSYLTLFDSFSSTLRQGWLELASARHSMGATRISSTLFDLNCHDAATSFKVNLDETSETNQPKFSLCKWGSHSKQSSDEDTKHDEEELLQGKSTTSQLRRRGTSETEEKIHGGDVASLTVVDQVQRERSKSLSMFGTLVSPKLRASQLSFESALDTLVEIANTRSAIVSAYNEARKETNPKGPTKQ